MNFSQVMSQLVKLGFFSLRENGFPPVRNSAKADRFDLNISHQTTVLKKHELAPRSG